MITFDEFITKWTDKPVDFDGVYPNQCMDLAHQYVYDVLGITDKSVIARAWAALVYTQFQWDTYFTKIANSPTGVPSKGDIVIWEEALNYDASVGHGYGHIAIFISGDVNNFKSFDANWPVGSLPHVQDHNYNHVLGWLNPKAFEAMANITQKELNQILADRDRNWNLYTQFKDAGYPDITSVNVALKSKQDTIDNLNQQVNDRNNDIVQLNAQISSLNAQVLSLSQAKDSLETQAKLVPSLTEENTILKDKLANYQSAEQTWNRSKAQLQKEIEDLKANAWKAFFASIFNKLSSWKK